MPNTNDSPITDAAVTLPITCSDCGREYPWHCGDQPECPPCPFCSEDGAED